MKLPKRISSLLSSKVEESVTLRLLALIALWTVALSLAWVGGSVWTWLGGGVAATAGHAFSYHRRQRSLGMWPTVMALMIVALALLMRSEILAALNGNWLPLAHYLLLVQAISSFDVRTRGGLYAGFALSGIVLFFASQQAFDLSFGIFLLGYAGLLMGFLARATLEDASRNTTGTPAYKVGRQLGFWSGTAAAMLLFSVAAFLLLPRGESNATGYQQVSALPITPGSDLSPDQGVNEGSSGARPSEATPGTGQPFSGNAVPGATDSDPGSSLDSGTAGGSPATPGELATPGSISTAEGKDVVMRVRSPVVSYWRGQVYDRFDGGTWQPDTGRGGHMDAGRVPRRAQRYAQTFFVEQGNPGAIFLGYRGVEVVFPQKSAYGASLGTDFSYRVLSVAPGLDSVALGGDTPGATESHYYAVPDSMPWLRPLARELTADAETGIDKALSVVEYVRRRTRYDPSAPDQLGTTGSLDRVLLDGAPSTSLELATATVFLARAAGLPARLATGYLPGERDLLSGAYTVREDDAHAWAEIKFREHGWVPFDGSDRADPYSAGGGALKGQIPGLKHLFESSVGDDLVRGVAQAPSRLSTGLAEAFSGPVGAVLAALVAGAAIAGLGWFSLRSRWWRRRRPGYRWSYAKLQGGGREELMRIQRRVENLLRSKGLQARLPSETLHEYANSAAHHLGGALPHLDWFTRAAWAAAYDSSPFPPETVHEARTRFESLRAELG